jgi:putative alpha-1,2-mannosidase
LHGRHDRGAGRDTERPGWDFDATVNASADEWNRWLSTITVDGGTEAQRIKFYTDLWHALLGRRTFSDVDGRYVDNTGSAPRVRQVPLDAAGRPTRATYNSDPFWGRHGNLDVLWSCACPRVMSGQISSLVDDDADGAIGAPSPTRSGAWCWLQAGNRRSPGWPLADALDSRISS